MRTLMTALMTAALCCAARAAVPTVTDVTLVQPEFTRKAVVTYKTSGAGIATCRFLNDDVPIGEPGEIRTVYGDIHQYLDAGEYEFTWDAGRDMPEQIFTNLKVEVKLWATNNPPEYCAVRLEEVGGPYRVLWYGCESEIPFGVTNDLYKTTHLLLRKIPSTEGRDITLGSPGPPNAEVGRNADREGRRDVRITEPFYMGVYQVTQRQWQQVGTSPNSSKWNNVDDWQTRPVEQVSYFDIRSSADNNVAVAGTDWPDDGHNVGAGSFLDVLRTKTGNLLEFDLPTEAQWEYACRAGTTAAWNNGTDCINATTDPQLNLLGRYQYNGGKVNDGVWKDPLQDFSAENATALVGSYLPNACGLYDMHGNVYEWCLDWFDNIKDGSIPEWTQGDNPTGPANGADRVPRGGSWNFAASFCRSAFRYNGYALSIRNYAVGLRLAARAAVLVSAAE